MPRFFIDTPPTDTALVTGEAANHIGRSLRMRPGENLTLCCAGTDYDCEIISITSDTVTCAVSDSRPSPAEPTVEVTLFQALPKADKMELIIQKAVELGVSRITPILTARCISRPDEKGMAKKVERWQKIARSAAEQSVRGMIPAVEPVIGFDECLARAKALDKSFFCYEKGGVSFTGQDFGSARSIGLIIGSEGGFEEAEAQKAEEAGLGITSLGKRILRCETAPLTALSAIMLLTGNL